MKLLINKINRLSIRNKILLFFYSIILMVTIFISLYFQNRHNQRLTDIITTQHSTTLHQIASDLSFIQDDLRDISTYLIINSDLQNVIEANREVETDTLYNQNNLKFIYKLIASKSYISSVIIYGHREAPLFFVYTDESTDNNAFSQIKSTDLYNICKNLNGKPYWHLLDTNNKDIILNNSFDKFALSRVIVNPLSKEFYYHGFLTITFNHDVIDKSLSSIINTEQERIVIYSDSGEKIYAFGASYENENTEFDWLQTMTEDTQYVDKQFIVSNQHLPQTDWTIYSITNRDYYTESYTRDSTVWLFIIIACIAITLPLSLVLSTYISAPIKRLLQSMKHFEEGDFSVSVPVKTYDEIGILSESYNKMVINIKSLIDEVYVLKLQEKEAELKALQAGINPHFLYNALDSIYWKALSNDQEVIAEMLFSLSQIFRLSLSRGNDRIQITKEFELVRHYLTLQKMRFNDKLNYTIHLDDTIKEQMIPKLIIQPFVENAIIHGIEPLDTPGKVCVEGYLSNDQIIFKIIDDGVGYAPDTKTQKTSSGYAIDNIKERLSFIYPSYELTIHPNQPSGTRVILKIPYKGDNNVQTINH